MQELELIYPNEARLCPIYSATNFQNHTVVVLPFTYTVSICRKMRKMRACKGQWRRKRMRFEWWRLREMEHRFCSLNQMFIFNHGHLYLRWPKITTTQKNNDILAHRPPSVETGNGGVGNTQNRFLNNEIDLENGNGGVGNTHYHFQRTWNRNA